MDQLNKITDAFKGEKEILILCSKKLALELDDELANMTMKENEIGFFKTNNKVDLGFRSVYYNGMTLHYRYEEF